MSIAEVVANKNFIGFIRIDSEKGRSLFIFFLNGISYAAGQLLDSRPSPLEVRQLFGILPPAGEDAWLSLYQTDPVLLKDLLVYFQKEPSLKALTELINVDGVLDQVRQESADAVLVLRRGFYYNFFFIKKGRLVMSHFSDPGFKDGKSLPIAEQIQTYAYRPDREPVEAFLYRDIATAQARDADGLGEGDLLDMMSSKESAPSPGTDAKAAPEKKIPGVVLSFVDGKEKGKLVSSSVPCIMGRKEANIIVPDPKVSRHHALLKIFDGKPYIEDMQSTNGTYVNGVEVKRAALKPGDVITIGETRLEFKRSEML